MRASRKASGEERIYTAGEKEYLAWLERGRGALNDVLRSSWSSSETNLSWAITSLSGNRNGGDGVSKGLLYMKIGVVGFGAAIGFVSR